MYIGTDIPANAYLGSQAVSGVYRGDTQIWPLGDFQILSQSFRLEANNLGTLTSPTNINSNLVNPNVSSYSASYNFDQNPRTDYSGYGNGVVAGEYKLRTYAFHNTFVSSWTLTTRLTSFRDGGYCVELGRNMFGLSPVSSGSQTIRELIFPSPKLHWQENSIRHFSGSLKLTDRNPTYTCDNSGKSIINSTIEIESSNWNNAWKNLTKIPTQFLFGTRFINFSGSMDFPGATEFDGQSQFLGVRGVDTINIPNATGNFRNSIERATFRYSRFREINIPSVTACSDNTFADNPVLETVDARSLQTASFSLFRNCTSLQNVNLSSALTSSFANSTFMVQNVPNNGTITLPQHWSGSSHGMYTELVDNKNWTPIFV